MNEQWKSITRGAVVAVLGALAAYGTASVIPALQASNDPRLLLLAAVLSVVVNVIRKWPELYPPKQD